MGREGEPRRRRDLLKVFIFLGHISYSPPCCSLWLFLFFLLSFSSLAVVRAHDRPPAYTATVSFLLQLSHTHTPPAQACAHQHSRAQGQWRSGGTLMNECEECHPGQTRPGPTCCYILKNISITPTTEGIVLRGLSHALFSLFWHGTHTHTHAFRDLHLTHITHKNSKHSRSMFQYYCVLTNEGAECQPAWSPHAVTAK